VAKLPVGMKPARQAWRQGKDPSRVAHAIRADGKARTLVDRLRPMDRSEAERYVAEHMPDPETIAALAFWRQGKASRAERPDALGSRLTEILKHKPGASNDEVIKSIRDDAVPGSWLEEVDEDGTVHWRAENGQWEATSHKSLAKRISRIRAKLGGRPK